MRDNVIFTFLVQKFLLSKLSRRYHRIEFLWGLEISGMQIFFHKSERIQEDLMLMILDLK